MLIQSRCGNKGNFELLTPMASGGLAHYWRNNDDPTLPWHGPTIFGQELGIVASVSFIERRFGNPGNLEIVTSVGTTIEFLWRNFGPAFARNGPTPIPANGISPVIITASEIPQNELYRCAKHLVRPIPPRSCSGYARRRSTKRTDHVKQAILAKVSVKKQSSDSVAVRLESDELSDATVIVSTGLDREKNSHQTPRVPLRCNLQG